MKTNDSDARDMAELTRTDSYASGEFNADLKTEATHWGLELNLGILIPWEWIDAARSSLANTELDSASDGDE